MKGIILKGLVVVAGAGLGFAYYSLIGCKSGTCPLTSTWYISTGYGALIGLVATFSFRPKRRQS